MAKIKLEAIRDFAGQDLGTSDWITIDQPMIDQFAACTGDRQWIHVDAGVRLQLSMTSVEPKDNGRLLIKSNAVLEIENSQTPALVAETLTLVVP